MKKILFLLIFCIPYAFPRLQHGKTPRTHRRVLVSKKARQANHVAKLRKEQALAYLEENATNPLAETSDLKVRVLLEKFSKFKEDQWALRVESEKGFITTQHPSEGKKLLIRNKAISIVMKDENLFIKTDNSEPRKISETDIMFSPVSKYMVLNGTPYQGSLQIHYKNTKEAPKVINHVKLDDYIYSILRYETYQSWPQETHKIQAIVSRTYALHHILGSRKRKRLYDIRNTSVHQNYHGYHPHEHLRAAVDETRNMIVSYDNKPAMTMFDICCGGAIPSQVAGIHFDKAPYLAREKKCTYCENYKFCNWKKEIDFNSFMENLIASNKLGSNVSQIGSIKDVKILRKDKAGLVRKIQLRGAIKNLVCSGKDLMSSMKIKLHSLTFNIKKTNEKNRTGNLIFSGKGIGHQVGLCQRGSYELVKKGWTFKEVLSFYFPYTKLGVIDQPQLEEVEKNA